ncbi:helix-turn-helix transcriptional regulator [Streptomyces sp. 3211]|uniref:helix-turn-helix transcriptional regulator n=1 Tax=Streptomyces sp. 3211 TaxID=1964449 RepID=UPI0009A4D685|nr:AraC family transcriptional regulator [Streptomyces sp. 3211]
MDDFASSTLVAAVQRALADDGIVAVAPSADGALLAFEAKRRFLAGVVERYGLLPLLRVGLVVPRMASDPAVSALLGASGPWELLERWQRLERFTHSRHRVIVREAGERFLVAEHVGPSSAPPEPAENVLVMGLVTVLLTMTGARGVTVTVGRDDRLVVFDHGVFIGPPPASVDSALWRFAWSYTAPSVRAGGVSTGSDVVSRGRRLLAGNLARRWSLQELAADLGTSARSLQRRLQGVGGFRGLLCAVRTEVAADLLINSRYAVSIVGFVCGYADQPHFTREFKRRTAVTPAAYRQAFGRESGQCRPDHLPVRERAV